MKKFAYKGKLIEASTKKEAMGKIVLGAAYDSDPFLKGYLAAALEVAGVERKDTDYSDGYTETDKGFALSDLTPEAVSLAKKNCDLFRKRMKKELDENYEDGRDEETAGEYFFLTHNGYARSFSEDQWKHGEGLDAEADSFKHHEYATTEQLLENEDGKVEMGG